MSKDTLKKLFWAFWCSTTMLTGIMAGFMISHSVMLGRFFTWYVESDNVELLRQTFTVFRETSSPPPQLVYNVPLYLAFLSGVIWTVLAFVLKRDRIVATIAGLSTFWVGNVFFISELNKAEEAVLSGSADATMTQYFAAINLPIHICFAAIYVVSLFLLLLVALKGRWAEAGAE